MSEWVAYATGTMTVELVADWSNHFRPGPYGPLEIGFDVAAHQAKFRRRAAKRRWCLVVVGILVSQHDEFAADGDFGVADLFRFRIDQAVALLSSECRFVE